MVILIGLTGGIACGKSTVSTLLQEKGLVQDVIDADKVARDLQRPGSSVLKRIKQEWPEVIDPNTGELDRKALGNIIFQDPSARRKLGRIMNPPIFVAILRAIFRSWWKNLWVRLRGVLSIVPCAVIGKKNAKTSSPDERRSNVFSSGRERIVILDAPTLYETKMFVPLVSNVLVVGCSPALQKERLLKRSTQGGIPGLSSITEEEAEQRIRSQMPLEQKKSLAGYVIDNEYNNDLEVLRRDVEQSVRWMAQQSSWKLDLLFGSPFLLLVMGLGGYAALRFLF